MGDARLDAAFAAVPRADFLPASQVRFAGMDQALPIGHGQTNSQPTTVRNLLTLLDVSPGHRVLDVGCGSGWTTALLGHLVGPDGSVVGVEVIPQLVDFGRDNLAGHASARTRIEPAHVDALGRPEEAPYDRILVSAEATTVPRDLVDQLVDGGVLVVPVSGRLVEVRRRPGWPDTDPKVKKHGHYAFVPLVGPLHGDRLGH